MSVALLFTGQGFQPPPNNQPWLDAFPEVDLIYRQVFGQSPNILPSNSNQIQSNRTSAWVLLKSWLWNLQQTEVAASYIAGYSVGQYGALYAGGCISQRDLVRLVFTRCLCLDRVADEINGGMIAVLGLPLNLIENICDKSGLEVFVSNVNCPGNVSISGKLNDLSVISKKFKQAGCISIKRLEVDGPWHSPLLKNAASLFGEVLRTITFAKSRIPIIDNVTGKNMDFVKINEQLMHHIYSRVNWHGSMSFMLENGVTDFIEVSHFPLLTRMGPYITRKASFSLVGDL